MDAGLHQNSCWARMSTPAPWWQFNKLHPLMRKAWHEFKQSRFCISKCRFLLLNFSSEVWESSVCGLWKKPHSHLHRSVSESDEFGRHLRGVLNACGAGKSPFCFLLCFLRSSGKSVRLRWEQRGSAGARRLRGEDGLPEDPFLRLTWTNQNARCRFKHLRRSHRWHSDTEKSQLLCFLFSVEL